MHQFFIDTLNGQSNLKLIFKNIEDGSKDKTKLYDLVFKLSTDENYDNIKDNVEPKKEDLESKEVKNIEPKNEEEEIMGEMKNDDYNALLDDDDYDSSFDFFITTRNRRCFKINWSISVKEHIGCPRQA